MSLHRFPLLALASMLYGGVAFGGEPAGLTWEDLFSGMRFERERLVSGAYSASGTEMPPGTDEAVQFTLYSVFSFAEQRIRFEHRGKGWVRRNRQLVEKDTHRLICLLPDRTYHFSDLSSSLQLNTVAPGTLEVKNRPGTRGFLDPRCLGMIKIDEMYDGIRFESLANKWSAGLAAKKVQIADQGDGVYRASQVGRRGRTSYWIDTKRGFTLVRCRVEHGKGDETTGEFIPFSQVVAEDEALRAMMKEKNLGMDLVVDVPGQIEMGWTEFDGVWVPVSYKYVMIVQARSSAADAGASPLKAVRRETALTFDWTSVNAELNDDLFDYHSFDLPVGTVVFDQRGPEAVFVEKLDPESASQKWIDIQANSRSYRALLIFHLVAAGIALAVAVASVAYRRRRSSNHRKAHA